jgi:hypothetical protein
VELEEDQGHPWEEQVALEDQQVRDQVDLGQEEVETLALTQTIFSLAMLLIF